MILNYLSTIYHSLALKFSLPSLIILYFLLKVSHFLKPLVLTVELDYYKNQFQQQIYKIQKLISLVEQRNHEQQMSISSGKKTHVNS